MAVPVAVHNDHAFEHTFALDDFRGLKCSHSSVA